MKKFREIVFVALGIVIAGAIEEGSKVINKKVGQKGPRIVDEDEFGKTIGYDYLEFDYYPENGAVVNAETNEEVINYDYYIGNLINDSSFNRSNRKVLLVVNDRISHAILINKAKGAFVLD